MLVVEEDFVGSDGVSCDLCLTTARNSESLRPVYVICAGMGHIPSQQTQLAASIRFST